jgi:hypothetical protein
MMEAGLDEITLSTHGIRRETYERMMKGASFETFHRTLRTIVEMKQKYGKTKPAIRITIRLIQTRLGQPDGISPSRMAEMLEVDKAGPIVRC